MPNLSPTPVKVSGPVRSPFTGANASYLRASIVAAGLDPAQMAIAFALARPFVTAVIIGATTLEQLETNIAAIDVTLPADVLAALDAVHAANPNPCP